jgi:putative MFS transporter
LTLIGRFVVPASPDGWRVAQILTALPIAMLLWWRRSLPESPRYLLARGRDLEAEAVVAAFERAVEAATGRPLPPSAVGDSAPASAPRTVTLAGALRFLWSPAMARRTAVTWFLWFVITCSYYGFFTWIPTLLVQRVSK